MTGEAKRGIQVYYRCENDVWWARSEDMPGWSGWNHDLAHLREATREAIFLETGCFPRLVVGLAGQLHGHDRFDLLDRAGW